jgi:cystathionine beta-synthase
MLPRWRLIESERYGIMDIFDNVIETIGHTPLIRLNSVTRGLSCTILAKAEFFNPGGSVKDRIGPTIVEDAENNGTLLPGGTIVEATSGNTGVGLALAATNKGYRCIFVMPDKMSQEKILLLRAFGARVVVTPTAVEPEDPRSYYSVAKKIVNETPNAILANQYHNPVNPKSHYDSTGPELWEQTDGQITHFVAGMGTGGTISGAGRYLKERNPRIQVVGVDPVGSILYDLYQGNTDAKADSYKVEGIGEDFLPGTTDLSVVDHIIRATDRDSFLMTRRLVREEGIFCGGSSGTAVWGAIAHAREHNLSQDHLMVVVLPDSGSRYLSKVFDDDWMRENGFLEVAWLEVRAADINAAKADSSIITAKPSDLMSNVVSLFKLHNISQVPVIDEEGNLNGIVTEVALLNHMLSVDHEHSAGETIEAIIDPNVPLVRPNTPLETLMDIFANNNVAFIATGDHVEGVLTKIDILDFISSQAT